MYSNKKKYYKCISIKLSDHGDHQVLDQRKLLQLKLDKTTLMDNMLQVLLLDFMNSTWNRTEYNKQIQTHSHEASREVGHNIVFEHWQHQ